MSSFIMSQTIDSEKLCTAFGAEFNCAKASDLIVKKLAGDASSREYFRIQNPLTGKSWVLQKSEPFAQTQVRSHAFLAGQKILQTIKIPVPEIIGVFPGQGWVLLEDLGDETLQTQKSFIHYQEAVKILAQLSLYADPKEPSVNLDCADAPHWGWAFDFEKLNFEMNFTAENLLRDFLHIESDLFIKATRPNTEYLANVKRYFCHRDYHSRNIMIQNGVKPIAVIDFQDARMGPLTYDIVSILWDPYVPLSEEWRNDLLLIWERALRSDLQGPRSNDVKTTLSETEAGVYDKWKVELERMIVQRMLKAAGSYASFFVKKNRVDYLPSIIPALQNSKDALNRLKKNFPKVWLDSDAELLTQTEYIMQKVSGSLKTV